MKEKSLSEKKHFFGEDEEEKEYYVYHEKDVKEAVKKLKEEIEYNIQFKRDYDYHRLLDFIDKIFGEFK